MDCYVSISRTSRILFHWIITLVSHALLGLFFIGLLRQSLHTQDSFSLSRALIGMLRQSLVPFRIYFSIDIASLVPRALLGFSLIGDRLVLWTKYKAHGEVNHRNQEFFRNSIENCSEIKVLFDHRQSIFQNLTRETAMTKRLLAYLAITSTRFLLAKRFV